MLTPDGIITSQSEEHPRDGHTLLLEHHDSTTPSRVGALSFEGIGLLWPPLPDKAIKLFLPASPQTVSIWHQ